MAEDHEPGEQQPDAEKAAHVQGQQVGDHNIQVNIFGETWSARRPQPPLAGESSPYRGLLAFEEEDQRLFFGRDDAVDELLERMARCAAGPGLLMVSGVSGAGKSSLLRAGMMPRLHRDGLRSFAQSNRWPCLLLVTPGRAPLAELAAQVADLAGTDGAVAHREIADDPSQFAVLARQAALAQQSTPGPSRLILVIDQFEQLFTQDVDERQRRAYVAALSAAARDEVALVVLGVRADFEVRCAAYPQLDSAINEHFWLGAMTARQLRAAITEPASRRGIHVDEALVSTLLVEFSTRQPAFAAQPTAGVGVLPLLSHALDLTWRSRSGNTITLEDYERTGGIEKAVAASAQAAYEGLTPAQQEAARLIFLHLTATTAEGTDTAVPVTRAEFLDDADTYDMKTVIDAFAERRLLTLAADTVEISHEVLLTAWPLLRDGWLAETREARKFRTRLRDTATLWAVSGRNKSYLYRGTVLKSAVAIKQQAADPGQRRHLPLGPDEEAFVRASVHARWRRIAAVCAVPVLVIAGGWIGAVKVIGASTSEREVTAAGKLATDSRAIGDSDPVRARLDAVAAWRLDPSLPQAQYAMQSAAALPGIALLANKSPGDVRTVAFSPDGTILAVGTGTQVEEGPPTDSGAIQLWDTRTHAPIGSPLTVRSAGTILSVAFSPDGTILAAGTANGGTELWSLANRRLLAVLPAGRGHEVTSVAFSPNGKVLATGVGTNNSSSAPARSGDAASYGGFIQLWDVATRQPDGQALVGDGIDATGTENTGEDITAVTFSPDGKTLAAAAGDDIVLRSPANPGPTRDIYVVDGTVGPLAFSPDGTTLAVATPGGVLTFAVRSGRQTGTFAPAATGGDFSSAAFSPDGRTLAIARDGVAELWDTQTHRQVGNLNSGAGTGSIGPLAFSPNGAILATGSPAGTELWSVPQVLGTPKKVLHDPGSVMSLTFAQDGTTLAVGTMSEAQVWNAGTGAPIGQAIRNGIFNLEVFAPLSPDGNLLAVIDASAGQLMNLRTHQQVALPGTKGALAATFSPDGKLLAVGTGNNGVQLWDPDTQQRLATLPSPGLAVQSVAFSPDGRLLAVTYAGGGLQFWNVASRQRDGGPIDSGAGIHSAVFSPDGTRVAVATNDGTQLVDVATHAPDGPPLPTGTALSVAWSPDGTVLAVATMSGTQLRNTATGQQIGNPLGSTETVALAWSPDGRTLAAGLVAGGVQLWDVSDLIAADTASSLCSQAKQTLTQAEWSGIVPGVPYHNVCP